MSKSEKLEINYEEFFAVLKECEKYTFLLFKELAKDMPTSFETDSFQRQYHNVSSANQIKLSDLSKLIWSSLKRGSKEVDKVHDELFATEQVEYFNSRFSDLNEIIDRFSIDKYDGWYDLDNPMESFVKLGKTAQLQIIQEGFLQIAVTNFENAKRINREREYARNYVSEEEREEIDRKIEEGRRIREVEKEVRVLDNLECVFCGKTNLDTTARRKYFCKPEDEFIKEKVFLSCYSCLKENKNKELTPNFGRFIKK